MSRRRELGWARISWLGLTLASVAVLWLPAPARAQVSATAILDRVRVNAARPIDFHAAVLPETVFVGQQATYQVAVMLSADARSRLRRNPEFLPPELRGLLAYELGSPTRVAPRSYDGSVYEAHVFQRALFPVASGALVVPAPQLTYSLPQSSSYFSREERYVVRAESASVVVKALPTAGKPDDFSGAVGVFKASVRLDTTTARVGDPLVLTLRVQGTGNVKLLPRPPLELTWASAVAGTERIVVDSSGPLVRGTKEFDWILTPAQDGAVAIPVLQYWYFDPYQRRYMVAESTPLSLTVKSGSLATVDESEPGTVLPLRPLIVPSRQIERWNGRGRPPVAWWPWLGMLVLVPLPALVLMRRRVSKARRKSAGAPTSLLRKDAAAPEDSHSTRARARDVRRDMLAALGSRVGVSPQDLVSRLAVSRVLRRAGVSRSTTREALALLDSLDRLGYAPDSHNELLSTAAGGVSESPAARTVFDGVGPLIAKVDAEAVPRARLPQLRLLAMIAVVTLGASFASSPLLSQQASSDERGALAVAREAYQRRAYSEASDRFEAIADANPHDPDVQFDWATAAWAAGDTVHAVVGWQRAARLTPLAADVQERLALLPAGARGGIADVPLLPIDLLQATAVSAWVAAWLALAWLSYITRRNSALQIVRWVRWSRVTAFSLACIGALAGGATWWALRTLDPSGLAVVARPETMRVTPGTDSDAMGGVTTGDIVRVLDVREGWQHVQHADGRMGWLPDVRLVAIAPARR